MYDIHKKNDSHNKEVWQSQGSMTVPRKYDNHQEVWQSQGSMTVPRKYDSPKEVWQSPGYMTKQESMHHKEEWQSQQESITVTNEYDTANKEVLQSQ